MHIARFSSISKHSYCCQWEWDWEGTGTMRVIPAHLYATVLHGCGTKREVSRRVTTH